MPRGTAFGTDPPYSRSAEVVAAIGAEAAMSATVLYEPPPEIKERKEQGDRREEPRWEVYGAPGDGAEAAHVVRGRQGVGVDVDALLIPERPARGAPAGGAMIEAGVRVIRIVREVLLTQRIVAHKIRKEIPAAVGPGELDVARLGAKGEGGVGAACRRAAVIGDIVEDAGAAKPEKGCGEKK